jgi:transcriptional regulator with XRE-family HTH domain
MATVVESEGVTARGEFHRFVRERRLRLDPESHVLGESRRFPTRIGRPVTQEELAEHLGISRQWYARFEGGAPAAFSTQLLVRLCSLLQLSAWERTELMRLAMPELVYLVRSDFDGREDRGSAFSCAAVVGAARLRPPSRA